MGVKIAGNSWAEFRIEAEAKLNHPFHAPT